MEHPAYYMGFEDAIRNRRFGDSSEKVPTTPDVQEMYSSGYKDGEREKMKEREND